MDGHMIRIIRLLIACIVFSPCVVFAQFHIPGVGDIGNLPGVEDLIAGIPGLGGGEYQPALTTSLDDSKTEVPFLDDYNPMDFKHLEPIPGWLGRYQLVPGRWQIDVESYCLKAGTHGPSEGRGYLYAPLKGPRALVIRHILHNSALHPEIPQHDIQELIWAILARTKISDMNDAEKRAAAALLTRQEIRDLNGGALGAIPDELWDQVFAHTNISPALQDVIETEARMRSMLTTGGATYDEIESVAVLAGDPTEQDTRNVPEQRWSYHPDGYFVRYVPDGYPLTHIFISEPDYCNVEVDELGRIVAVSDNKGNRLEAEYDGSIAPLTIDSGAQPVGYAFSKLRFAHTDPQTSAVTGSREWNNVGWTLIGVPPVGKQVDSRAAARYTEIGGSVDWAMKHFGQVKSLYSLAAGSPERSRLAMNAVRLGVFTHAVQQVVGPIPEEEESAARTATELLMEAWQYQILLTMRSYQGTASTQNAAISPRSPRKGSDPGRKGGGTQEIDMWDDGFDLSGGSDDGNTAQPGNEGSQRLGLSSRESGGGEGSGGDQYDKGWKEGHWGGFKDGWTLGLHGGPYTEPDLPLMPLESHDGEWNRGFDDGWDQGWKDGYGKGIRDYNNDRIERAIDDGFRQIDENLGHQHGG